jgi:hypothetical protein
MLIPSVITDSAKRTAIINFLRWGLTKGQDYLEPLSYARLPNAVIAMEEAAIRKIKSRSTDAAGRNIAAMILGDIRLDGSQRTTRSFYVQAYDNRQTAVLQFIEDERRFFGDYLLLDQNAEKLPPLSNYQRGKS